MQQQKHEQYEDFHDYERDAKTACTQLNDIIQLVVDPACMGSISDVLYFKHVASR